MFELAATFALALIYAIIVGVRKGAHKEGPEGVVVFAILFGIAFALIVGLFALIELLSG
jgi:hypothetical protein